MSGPKNWLERLTMCVASITITIRANNCGTFSTKKNLRGNEIQLEGLLEISSRRLHLRRKEKASDFSRASQIKSYQSWWNVANGPV
jgi:hypothetical protein